MEEKHRARYGERSKDLPCSLGLPFTLNLYMLNNLETLNIVLLGSYGISITEARFVESLTLGD